MTGYTKLFGTILDSSIWSESKETKILWITMLAMAGKEGLVEAAIPGLASRAKLTLDETKQAIKILESPDPYSKNPDNDGRRIQRTKDGWLILNHARYRDRMNADERLAYQADWQKEYRKRKKTVDSALTNVDTRRQELTELTHTAPATATEASTKAKGGTTTPPSSSPPCFASNAQIIAWEKSLERINQRLLELKDSDLEPYLTEKRTLKASRKVLLSQLGLPA